MSSIALEYARRRVVVLASIGLVVALGALAYAIESSQQLTRARQIASFELRGTSSATFVGTFLSQQAASEQQTAEQFLSGRQAPAERFRVVASILEAFVDHTISYRQHEVFLVGASGRLIAASPATSAPTLAQADPALARSVIHAANGSVIGAREASMFTVAPVAGTPWRLMIAVPDSRLYASTAGWSQRIPWLVFALVSVLGSLLVALLARSHADRARLRKLSVTLEQTARTDALTGLLNRRALTQELSRVTAQARRRGESLSVLMIDLDRFKETNDRFGHGAGDRVLRAVAHCMHDVLRGEDAFGRWGGDEFLVAMSATGEEEARMIAERLHAAAASTDLTDIGLENGVPMSVGAATAIAEMTPEEIVRAADLDLYRAKAANTGTDSEGRVSERGARA